MGETVFALQALAKLGIILAMETMYIWAIGFLLGLKHSLDPDHLMAVSTIVSRHRQPARSALAGIFWGIGHTGTLFLAALVILVLGLTVPEAAAGWFEFFVGVMLVWLGIGVVHRAFQARLHLHRHRHDDRVHVHFHTHESDEDHVIDHAHDHGRSVLVGMAHGLAGSAGFMLLLVSQVDSLFAGLVYVAVFGLGTILGMMIFGGMISLPLRASAGLPRLNSALRFAVGLGSLVLGATIMIENLP